MKKQNFNKLREKDILRKKNIQQWKESDFLEAENMINSVLTPLMFEENSKDVIKPSEEIISNK